MNDAVDVTAADRAVARPAIQGGRTGGPGGRSEICFMEVKYDFFFLPNFYHRFLIE